MKWLVTGIYGFIGSRFTGECEFFITAGGGDDPGAERLGNFHCGYAHTASRTQQMTDH